MIDPRKFEISPASLNVLREENHQSISKLQGNFRALIEKLGNFYSNRAARRTIERSSISFISEPAAADRHGGHNNRVQMKLLPHPDVNYRKLMEFRAGNAFNGRQTRLKWAEHILTTKVRNCIGQVNYW